MALEDIPLVSVDFDGDMYKFVHVKARNGPEYLYSGDRSKYHLDIYVGFKRLFAFHGGDVSALICEGGGFVGINLDKKVIYAFDRSTDFGKFDINAVRRLLTEYAGKHLHGFSVECW